MPIADEADTGSADPIRSALRLVAEALVVEVLAALERRPEFYQLRAMLAAGVSARSPGAFMSVEGYAAHRAVSPRTISYDIKKMTEGVQYQYAGQKKGRVVINVEAADAWYAQRSCHASTTASSIEQLAVDEVTRRRARVALKKKKET